MYRVLTLIGTLIYAALIGFFLVGVTGFGAAADDLSKDQIRSLLVFDVGVVCIPLVIAVLIFMRFRLANLLAILLFTGISLTACWMMNPFRKIEGVPSGVDLYSVLFFLAPLVLAWFFSHMAWKNFKQRSSR